MLDGGGTPEERKQDGSLHLDVEQAKLLVKHLQEFLKDTRDPEHWKNDPGYIKVWRE